MGPNFLVLFSISLPRCPSQLVKSTSIKLVKFSKSPSSLLICSMGKLDALERQRKILQVDVSQVVFTHTNVL
ncbi:hypothetical protein G9P44_005196 [Scheffersomyces stipitis]|nr:hypothetical protein G9P44_005196 [Scheffersomyces stipitis]